MDIIPAIDLLDGKCVRLLQGDFEKAKEYSGSPLTVARGFKRAGARRIHVVDLDAARDAPGNNRAKLERLVQLPRLQVQVAGGIRTARDVKAWLDMGAAYVVVGTLAVEQPGELQRLASKWPGRILIALDVRDDMLSTHGWQQTGGVSVREMVDLFEAVPLAGYVYTDIERDGTMAGPNPDGIRRITALSAHPVIISGGITSTKDLGVAKAAGAAGAIIGRALYENTLDLALSIAEFEGPPLVG